METIFFALTLALVASAAPARTWKADNGNGTLQPVMQPVKLTKQGAGALRPPADPSPNLALGQTATASSTQPDGGHENVMLQSLHTDTKTALVRYRRLTILKGTPGLWEFRVY
jgi:hypothetical protein